MIKNRNCVCAYNSVLQIWTNEKTNISRAMYLIAHLEEYQIDINELEDVLDEVFEEDINILKNIGPAGRTNIRRVIMIYDCLKWKK